MRSFSNQPIRQKLLLIILTTVVVSLVLVVGGIVGYELSTYRERLGREIVRMGDLVAVNSAPALAFNDPSTAKEILSTLDFSPAISTAVIYRRDGSEFAAYFRKGERPGPVEPSSWVEGLRSTAGQLELIRPVEQKKRRLGTLYLKADVMSRIYGRLQSYAGVMLMVLVGIGAGAFFLQVLLRQLISDPLQKLTRMAERITAGDLTARITVDSGDEIGQLAATFNQMTAKLARSYADIEESRARLAGIVSSAMDAIITADNERRIVLFNAAAERMLGCAAADALGGSIGRFIPSSFFNLEKNGRPTVAAGSLTAFRADGEEFPAEASLSVVTVAGNRLVTVILRDITERKRTEEERERLLGELSRSNRELEQFAYVASHDLQEPLRMVASYVQLIEERYRRRLGRKAETYISYAVDGARRMQKLIQGLLQYSRITRKGAEFKALDAGRPLSQALLNLTAAIEESGATITNDELPVVDGDETQLVQLFQNLIGNAIKYRKPNVPPVIHVGVKRQAREWIFSVQDNGIGIDPHHFERIFLIFQRLHTREEYAGTGIGLALCKRIVERHGGRIWVESAPGQGSVFFFALPVPPSS